MLFCVCALVRAIRALSDVLLACCWCFAMCCVCFVLCGPCLPMPLKVFVCLRGFECVLNVFWICVCACVLRALCALVSFFCVCVCACAFFLMCVIDWLRVRCCVVCYCCAAWAFV